MRWARVAAGLLAAGLLAGCSATVPSTDRAGSPAVAVAEQGERREPARTGSRSESRRAYIERRIERRLRELRHDRARVVRIAPDLTAQTARVDALFRAVGIDTDGAGDAGRLAGAVGSDRPVPPAAGLPGSGTPPAEPAAGGPDSATSADVEPAGVEPAGGIPAGRAGPPTPSAPEAGKGPRIPVRVAGTGPGGAGAMGAGPAVPPRNDPVPPVRSEAAGPDLALASTITTGSLLEHLPGGDSAGAGSVPGDVTVPGDATRPGDAKTRGAHLASYPDRVSAMRGWLALLERHPLELGLHVPLLVDSGIGGGADVRLFTAVGEPDDVLRILCRGIRTGGGYCVPVDVPRPGKAQSGAVPSG